MRRQYTKRTPLQSDLEKVPASSAGNSKGLMRSRRTSRGAAKSSLGMAMRGDGRKSQTSLLEERSLHNFKTKPNLKVPDLKRGEKIVEEQSLENLPSGECLDRQIQQQFDKALKYINIFSKKCRSNSRSKKNVPLTNRSNLNSTSLNASKLNRVRSIGPSHTKDVPVAQKKKTVMK